jgi:hypothetical protein
MMKTLTVVLLLGLLLLTAGIDDPEPPDAFELGQNVPNPFCGYTEIRMTLPQQAVVLLEVWNPEMTATLRTLVHGALPAGYHSVLWDGRDDDGFVLSDGNYPYTMTATDFGTGELLFDDVQVATLDCTVPVRPTVWSAFKATFGK